MKILVKHFDILTEQNLLCQFKFLHFLIAGLIIGKLMTLKV